MDNWSVTIVIGAVALVSFVVLVVMMMRGSEPEKPKPLPPPLPPREYRPTGGFTPRYTPKAAGRSPYRPSTSSATTRSRSSSSDDASWVAPTVIASTWDNGSGSSYDSGSSGGGSDGSCGGSSD